MKIDEFMADKDLVVEYEKWIRSEIGIIVLSVLRETFLRPIQPGQVGQLIDQYTAAYCLGENSGAWKIVEAIESLGGFSVKSEETVDEDYGVTRKETGE